MGNSFLKIFFDKQGLVQRLEQQIMICFLLRSKSQSSSGFSGCAYYRLETEFCDQIKINSDSGNFKAFYLLTSAVTVKNKTRFSAEVLT